MEYQRSGARALQVKFRLSPERRGILRRLANEAGVSEQVYIEARLFNLPFEAVEAPGRTHGLKRQDPELPLTG